MYQLEFEWINNRNDVASILWTEIPPRDLICHALKESHSRYPHPEHLSGSSHLVSFVGQQILYEQRHDPCSVQAVSPKTTLKGKTAADPIQIITENINYSFQSADDLKVFRETVFGKVLVDCAPIDKISRKEKECETDTISLWEGRGGTRTVVYYRNVRDMEHIELEVVCPDFSKKNETPSQSVILRVRNPSFGRLASFSSTGTSDSNSSRSRSKEKEYQDLKIKFESVERKDHFVRELRQKRTSIIQQGGTLSHNCYAS